MSLRHYLADRLPLLLAFATALLFLLLVIQLGYAALRAVDVLYILLLALVAAAIILGLDYLRQRPFREAVRERLNDDEPPRNASLPEPVTHEQRHLSRLLDRQTRQQAAQLADYQSRVEHYRTFVDNWVHHMKTPLSVLELMAQEAQEASQGEELRRWESGAEELDTLSEGLDLMLAQARLDSFELDLRPVRLDLVKLARQEVNELKRAWIRNGVYPQVQVDGGEGSGNDPVEIESDAKWLALILRQLLTNAIKYSAAKGSGGTVTVTVTRRGSGATLSVEDHGIGIPEHDLPRVFERFFTGENGRTTKASTGMGLYLVDQVASRLGHRVELSSQEGKGTIVTIHFRTRGLHRLEERA